MSSKINKIEKELLENDLIFNEKTFSITFHNHKHIKIFKIKIYRNFEYNINIEIEGRNEGYEYKYLDSLFGKEIKFMIKNKSTLDSYEISCILNKRNNTLNSEGETFDLYGIVNYVNYNNNFIEDVENIQEWYLYNSFDKLKLLQSTDYVIKNNFLVKKRKGNYYKGKPIKNYYDMKIDLRSLNHYKINIEDLKGLRIKSMDNLLLNFNNNKFYMELIKNNDERFLIIEYNKEFGIPSKNVIHKIHYLFSFLFGSNLIKISEKYYNTSYQLFNEKAVSPYIHDLKFTLNKTIQPINFVDERDKFLEIFHDMSIIYSEEKYNFLDDVFKEYFYISSLEPKSELILSDALFDMIVKGYCYHILNINQIFDDKQYYAKDKNRKKCIEKFTSSIELNNENIDDAIKTIRNSVTHGDYKIKKEDIIKAKFYYRTLINESILKILGYNGEFINYYKELYLN